MKHFILLKRAESMHTPEITPIVPCHCHLICHPAKYQHRDPGQEKDGEDIHLEVVGVR